MTKKTKASYLIAVITIVIIQAIFIFYKNQKPQLISFEILAEASHDPGIFTEGFEIDNGMLYESSGRVDKKSFIQYTSLTDEKIKVKEDTPSLFSFAEGLTILGDHIYWLTWKANKAFLLDKTTLKHLKTFEYDGEGWGLTHTENHLVMSNGTDTLKIFEPGSFKLLKELKVAKLTRKWKLNELDYNNGFLLANVWEKPYIAVIKLTDDSATLVSYLDLAEIEARHKNHKYNVLNGIAYDKSKDAYWITGKRWDKKYLIKPNI